MWLGSFARPDLEMGIDTGTAQTLDNLVAYLGTKLHQAKGAGNPAAFRM
jgi:hypothetical protein